MKPKRPSGYREILKVFGNPVASPPGTLNRAWALRNIVMVNVPYPLYYYVNERDTVIVRSVSIHRLLAEDLYNIFCEIYAAARWQVKQEHGFELSTPAYDKLTLEKLHTTGADVYGGSFNYRKQRGSTRLSTHAFGIAIDIDPMHNVMGSKDYRMPQFVVEVFEKHGWVWGGRFRRIDAMHFQYCDNY